MQAFCKIDTENIVEFTHLSIWGHFIILIKKDRMAAFIATFYRWDELSSLKWIVQSYIVNMKAAVNVVYMYISVLCHSR